MSTTDPEKEAYSPAVSPAGPPGARDSRRLRGLQGADRWTALAAAWLLVLGCLASVVGAHDALIQADIDVQALGLLLLLAGIVLSASAVALLRNTPNAPSLALIAALVAATGSLLAFAAQLINDEPSWRLVAWFGIFVISVVVAVRIRAGLAQGVRIREVWSRFPVVSSVVSIGFISSLVQFWYSQIYLPDRAPPFLTIEIKTETVTTRGQGTLVVQGTVGIENTSDTRTQVLGSTLDVIAARVVPEQVPPTTFADRVRETDLGVSLADRYRSRAPAELVSHRRLASEGSFLDAGERATIPFLTWLPRGRYSEAHVVVRIAVGRGETLGIEDAPREALQTRDGVGFRTRLPEEGWLRALTRGERYLHVSYDKNPRVPFAVGFSPHRETDPPFDVLAQPGLGSAADDVKAPHAEFSKRMGRYYGVTTTDETAIVSLPQ